jgi:hypothetical protein
MNSGEIQPKTDYFMFNIIIIIMSAANPINSALLPWLLLSAEHKEKTFSSFFFLMHPNQHCKIKIQPP